MKIFICILRWYLLIEYILLLTVLRFTGEIFLSVNIEGSIVGILSINIEGITVGIKWNEKNQKVQ